MCSMHDEVDRAPPPAPTTARKATPFRPNNRLLPSAILSRAAGSTGTTTSTGTSFPGRSLHTHPSFHSAILGAIALSHIAIFLLHTTVPRPARLSAHFGYTYPLSAFHSPLPTLLSTFRSTRSISTQLSPLSTLLVLLPTLLLPCAFPFV
jgi:hypothetical protein